jgi:hypothetical protein
VHLKQKREQAAPMVPIIGFPSRGVKTFVNGLGLLLTQPQQRRLKDGVEGRPMTDGREILEAA